MNKYPDYYSVVIGTGPIGIFLGFLTIAFFAALISILQNLATRNVASEATPVKWSTKFMLVDNAIRFLANILVIPLIIRISYESLSFVWEFVVAVVSGIGVDRLALWLKNIGVFAMDKFTEQIKAKISDHTIITKNDKA